MNTSDLPLPICMGLETQTETVCYGADEIMRKVGLVTALDVEPEPFSETPFVELWEEYNHKGRLLTEQGADYLLLRGFTNLPAARAAVLGCRSLGVPVWLAMDSDHDGETPCGEDVTACLVALQDLGLQGFGLVGLDPIAMKPLYAQLREYAKIPLLALPLCTADMTPAQYVDACEGLMRRSVTILGCHTGCNDTHLRLLKRMMRRFDIAAAAAKPSADEDDVLLAANEVFHLDTDLEYSPPVECSRDMADDLLDATQEACDVVLVELDTPDDGYLFAQNAHMVDLPVAFQSESLAALRSGLFYYNGKAILRSTEVELEREELEALAKEYGAVVM